MYGFRSLMLSFAVVFALMLCVGTSVQAAEVLEQRDLSGPTPFVGPAPGIACVGEVVGRTTIEKKGEDLAQQIVGAITGINKSDDSITVTIRFRNGPPNQTMLVKWRPLDVPGDCATPTAGTFGKFIGTISTDADGAGRTRIVIPENPFPTKGVKLYACIPNANPNCGVGDTVYWSLFTEVF